jgi:hypothetical protein
MKLFRVVHKLEYAAFVIAEKESDVLSVMFEGLERDEPTRIEEWKNLEYDIVEVDLSTPGYIYFIETDYGTLWGMK